MAELNKKKQELIEALSNVDEELGEMFLNEAIPSKELLKVIIFLFSYDCLILEFYLN
jgi:hypothetical protein